MAVTAGDPTEPMHESSDNRARKRIPPPAGGVFPRGQASSDGPNLSLIRAELSVADPVRRHKVAVVNSEGNPPCWLLYRPESGGRFPVVGVFLDEEVARRTVNLWTIYSGEKLQLKTGRLSEDTMSMLLAEGGSPTGSFIP